MFGYRHAFHAGNFADVFKHVILLQLLHALRGKDKPFFVLDTHAGAGRYDLRSAQAQKRGEFHEGIGRLWGKADLNPELDDYVRRIAAFNSGEKLLVYPGSPRLIQARLRAQDRLTLCELHPTEFPLLKDEFAADRHVSILHLDGYAALKAQLPPKEKRGLVFIDPSFEMTGEFDRLIDALKLVYARWRNGMVAIWYPILHRSPSERFHDALRRLEFAEILCAELGIAPYDSPQGMHGCGMIVVNPPWKLDILLRRVLPELLVRLDAVREGQTRVEWLSGEGA